MIEIVNPSLFFQEKLNKYFEENKIKIQSDTEKYLVDVLNKYIHIDQIQYGTLFEIYEQCVYNNKIEDYAHLGEHSLYIGGMFPGSITKSLVNINYYIDMGTLGFTQASQMSRSKIGRKIYQDLSLGFKTYMNSFYVISNDSLFKDTLSLYDQYEQTKNPAIMRDLLNLKK